MDSESLLKYSEADSLIRKYESDWSHEFAETERRRTLRQQEVNIHDLRNPSDPASPRIASDATYIVRRICDANILRESAPYINYITRPRVVAKFRPLRGNFPTDALEQEFTKVAQYRGWKQPFFRWADGAIAHGVTYMETVLDIKKPGAFRNEDIPHDGLLYAWDTEGLQDNELVGVYKWSTLIQLKQYAEEYGFDPKQTQLVYEALEAKRGGSGTLAKLVKTFIKPYEEDDAPVYVGWRSELANDWLLKPKPLYLGVASEAGLEFETEFPIEPLQYSVCEDARLANSRGRIFKDEYDQEAATQMFTALVNKMIRSQYSMWMPDQEVDASSPAQTDFKFGDGAVWNMRMREVSPEAPDAALVNIINALVTQNAQEFGQINFAAQNRQDSRKTATEIDAAMRQSAQLNTAQVTLLSEAMAGIWKRCFRIFRSQVLQGKIESELEDHIEAYGQEYEILAAGDSEVIHQAEDLQRRKQDWPVMSQTAAATEFLKDILIRQYPDDWRRYVQAIQNENRKDNLLIGMARAIETITSDGGHGVKPEFQAMAQQLQELASEYEAVTNPEGAKQNQSAPK